MKTVTVKDANINAKPNLNINDSVDNHPNYDMSQWDVSSVIDFSHPNYDMSQWDVSSVMDLSHLANKSKEYIMAFYLAGRHIK